MATMNAPRTGTGPRTHEGAPAVPGNPLAQLRRSVLSCLLWESEFYEDGKAIADRITTLAQQVGVEALAALCVEARSNYNLRHVPLLLLTVLIERGRGNPIVAQTIATTVQRADELTELLALYWRNGKRPLSGQLKRGLAAAFAKFDAYQLGKYDRANAVRLRDVLFLSHAKPKDEAQAGTWKQLVDNTLPTPDTWETELSAGKDKRETWERLLGEGRLGYLALLRNLRNMIQATVPDEMIRAAIVARKGAARVLPFRYVAAARAVPRLEPALDEALSEALADVVPLPGRTIVLVDVSGSMNEALSSKSDLTRMDAGATLASVLTGDLRVFTFSHELVEVPPRRGMAGIDAVRRSQPHGGTYLGKAVSIVNAMPHDRLIVITDEQSADAVPAPAAKYAYMVNVASAKNGVGFGSWTRVNGFSEQIIRFIGAYEAERTQ
jgi:60 kDa SS-A/Ro ribonucleoprotein